MVLELEGNSPERCEEKIISLRWPSITMFLQQREKPVSYSVLHHTPMCRQAELMGRALATKPYNLTLTPRIQMMN